MYKLMLIACSLLIASCSSQSNDTTAEKNLCDINLNKIANYSAQYSTTTGEPEDSQLKELHAKAKQYKEAGDTKNCIAVSEQALAIIALHSNH